MVESNNAINNTVGASITGVTNTLTVTNASDTASSAARGTITVGGTSAGDPSLNFNVSGVTDFEMGIDNNAADSFKISASAALGTTDTFIMTTAGERTMPLQPCFRGNLGGALPNLTGDGTDFGPIIFLNEVFDQNNDYDVTTGIFTAPVTGIYAFRASLKISNLSSSFTSLVFTLTTTSATIILEEINIGAVRSSANRYSCLLAQIQPMTAGDTASISFTVSGGTKTVGLTTGNANAFMGFLVA